MRGRKPKTPEERARKGEARTAVLIGGREAPPRPAYFTPSQRKLWDELIRYLAEGGVLDRADGFAVEALVITIDTARQAGALLRDRDLLTANSQGVVANPALLIQERNWKEARQMMEQLPLSPLGRARLSLHGTQPADDITRQLGEARPALRAVE